MDMRHDDFDDLLGGTPEKERAVAAGPRNGSEITQDKILSQENTAIAPDTQASDDHDDLMGGSPEVSAIDLPLSVTLFPDHHAKRKVGKRLSLRDLAGVVSSKTAPEKGKLPMVKLATFGDVRTEAESYRHDGNMRQITGIEADYDGESLSVGEGAERLKEAGIAALLYSSASHTPERPRWRVMCPLSSAVNPYERKALVAALNGALGGILAPESFTASQAYYYGQVRGKHPVETALVDGKPLDRVRGLTPVYSAAKGASNGSTSGQGLGKGRTGKPLEVIASALMAIPNDGSADYKGTLERYGLAMHEEGQGAPEYFEAFCRWAEQHPRFDWNKESGRFEEGRGLRMCKSVWPRHKGKGTPDAIAGWSIIKDAIAHGWELPPASDDDLGFEDQDGDDFDDLLGSGAPEQAKPSSRLTFLSPAECVSAPARSYLIKGLIAERDVACVFGAPGAGKSLLAPFLGYAVAQGREAFGMRTKPGNVFYVAAEDEHGMRGRVRALQQAHGDADQFYLVGGVSNLLAADSPDLKELARAVKAQRPKLIVIDTLAMAFPGLEENSADAMGRVVAVARALTNWGAAVVLIHHDTKSEGGTPRGHSVLNGALDVAIHVKRDDSAVIRGRLTKNRNGTCDRDIAFRIVIEDGGVDEDGDQITLPRCEELNAAQAPAPVKLTKAERAVMDVIHIAGGEIPESELRKLCIEGHRVSTSDNQEAKRKAVYRALGGLEEKRRIVIEGGHISAAVLSRSIEGEFEECDDDLG
ncbi:AAA family ATPase [uncultured Paracoccus sp.]|uniref:AAA family ATPase n=1 Tax=uncultured Paracoccus sp. TaxID=189685 RepID=UPI0025CC0837|nr:AAA family ATPase [uncultured Paracoccus sp.]